MCSRLAESRSGSARQMSEKDYEVGSPRDALGQPSVLVLMQPNESTSDDFRPNCYRYKKPGQVAELMSETRKDTIVCYWTEFVTMDGEDRLRCYQAPQPATDAGFTDVLMTDVREVLKVGEVRERLIGQT